MAQESAARCLDFGERPSTPHNIRKYRKSYFSEPGAKVTHPGAIDDERKLREKIAREAEEHKNNGGRRMFELENKRLFEERQRRLKETPEFLDKNTQNNRGYCSTLEGVFHETAHGSFAEYLKSRNESIYRSHQLEPLGKPYVRGHKLSAEAIAKLEVKSTKQSAQGSTAAKNLIYAIEQNENKTNEEKERDEVLARRLYIKSHGSYGPGQQKQRDYAWKGINPKEYRFGANQKTSSILDGSVAACLQPATGEVGNVSKTVITNRTVEVFKQFTSDPLGKPKPRGFNSSIRRHGREEDEWTAEKCIQGQYSLEEQLPDKDLGKATREGWRNQVKKEEDTTRYFGCPTVRTDIPMPTRCSVSDSQNYGDDTNAAMLLYPTRFSEIGVEDQDFLEPMTKEDLSSIFRGIGHDLSDDDVDRLFARAASITEFTSEGKVSIHDFRIVLNEKIDSEDAGNGPPHWW